jgi:hypothetical protein
VTGLKQEVDMEQYIPAASVQAYRQLLALNLQLYKPEVTDWLHSEEAEPVLSQILLNVPCSETLH